jgi:hypothetical protein
MSLTISIMNVPGIVQSSLGDEHVAAKVSLGGEDVLYVTPTRTLIYRADGLLSDESVEEYPHDAERITVSEGRRKSIITLDYGIDGSETFKIPTKRLHDALHPVVAGVLNGAGVTDSNEQVLQTYQFSELTLVLTSARVVKHVGEAIWDTDFEQFHFDDVTSLDVEEGTVSSQIIIEADGRPQRIKTPSERGRSVNESSRDSSPITMWEATPSSNRRWFPTTRTQNPTRTSRLRRTTTCSVAASNRSTRTHRNWTTAGR